MENFDYLLSMPKVPSLTSKAAYQKGVCLIKLGNVRGGCHSFDRAIKMDDLPSIRANIVNACVTLALEKLNQPNDVSVSQAEDIFRYLILLEVPYKFSYVALPKKILLYYFDKGDYLKCIQNLDRLKTHYSANKGIVAFSLWKKGRAYMELAKIKKLPGEPTPDYGAKAIQCYESILEFYPEVPMYKYFSCEELATLYRARGKFRKANNYERQMIALKKDPELTI
jgi:tetratricopeptide (TPR) repeat protein